MASDERSELRLAGHLPSLPLRTVGVRVQSPVSVHSRISRAVGACTSIPDPGVGYVLRCV
eukprot:6575624-Prymnesium_polylepis.1